MEIWITQDGEPIPEIDKSTREWRSAMLSKALVKAGHEVLWWASTFDHARKKHWFNRPKTIEVIPGLTMRLLHSTGYRSNKSLKRFWHQRRLADKFLKEAETYNNKPDLIYASLPTLELAEKAVNYGNRYNIPVIVDVRDLWPDIYLTLSPKLLSPILKFLLFSEFLRCSRILSKATGIVTISKAYMNWALLKAKRAQKRTDGLYWMGYRGQSAESSKVSENKRYELREKFQLKTEDLILTFVGSFTQSFDMLTLIEAARVLKNKGFSKIKMVIIGEGDMGSTWREQAKDLQNIVFTGWLDQISISAILSLSDVSIAPYDNSLISLPNKPFEYMASGLPLLSSLKGELEELIKEEKIGLQYKAGDVDSLVQQIKWLYEHPQERKEMGMRAKRLFEERYNADIIYPMLVEHLERVVRAEDKA